MLSEVGCLAPSSDTQDKAHEAGDLLPGALTARRGGSVFGLFLR